MNGNPRFFISGPRGRWSAASDGRYKLILIPESGGEIFELYDLAADPGDTTNRISDPALAEVRVRLLRAVLDFEQHASRMRRRKR